MGVPQGVSRCRIPTGVPGRGGAPRAGQREIDPRPGGRPGRLVRGVAPLAAAGRRRRGPRAARYAHQHRAGGAAPPAPRESRRTASRKRPHEPLPVHPRGAGRVPGRRPVSRAHGGPLGLLCVGAPRGLGARHRRRGAGGAERRRPCGVAGGGVRCACKWVARLLRAAGLVGGHRRRRVRTTVADPTRTPAPNLVARDYTAPATDRRWIGDSTFVPTGAGRRFLAVLLDVHARRVVGWAMRRAGHRRARAGPGATAALPGTRPPHRSRGPRHRHGVPVMPRRTPDHLRDEPDGGMSRQRHGRAFLLDPHDRTGGSAPLADTRCGAAGKLRVARSSLQPSASPGGARLPEPVQLRGAAVVVAPTGCLALSCPRKRVRPKSALQCVHLVAP